MLTGAGKALLQTSQLFGRNAGAVVFDHEGALLILAVCAHGDAQLVGAVLAGVVQQIEQQHADQRGIAPGLPAGIVGRGDIPQDLALRPVVLHQRGALQDQLVQINDFGVGLHLIPIHACEQQ